MSKNKQVLVLLIVIVIIFIGAALFVYGKRDRHYSAVYLRTGDFYIGKVSRFPTLSITDAFGYQASIDPTNPERGTFQIIALKDLPWSPDKLVLNRKQVMFVAPIPEGSQVLQAIKEIQAR